MNPIVEKLRKLRSEMPWRSSGDAHAQMERNREIVAQASGPAWAKSDQQVASEDYSLVAIWQSPL